MPPSLFCRGRYTTRMQSSAFPARSRRPAGPLVAAAALALLVLVAAIAVGPRVAHHFTRVASVDRAGSGDLIHVHYTNLDGAPLTLAPYLGKPMLLNMWATWCPNCVVEMPALQRFAKAHPAITVIGIDEGEQAFKVRSYLAAKPTGYPIVLDPEQSVSEGIRAWGIPTSILLDREGRIVRMFTGSMSYRQMEAFASSALPPA